MQSCLRFLLIFALIPSVLAADLDTNFLMPGVYEFETANPKILRTGTWVNYTLLTCQETYLLSNNGKIEFSFYGNSLLIYQGNFPTNPGEYYICIDDACKIYSTSETKNCKREFAFDGLATKIHSVEIRRELRNVFLESFKISGPNTYCGNKILEEKEECDDANDLNTDDCLTTCKINSCGDGYLKTGYEECDDGNEDNTDSCSTACKKAFCGDMFVWKGHETCEKPNTINNTNCSQLASICTSTKTGSRDSLGDCSSTCSCVQDVFIYQCVKSSCGATCSVNSDCNDGNQYTTDTCSQNTCTCEYLESAGCGNAILDTGEECDDGNSNNNDLCLSTCKNAFCGDGYVKANSEICDEGQTNGLPSHCNLQCSGITASVCGNSVLENGEECENATNEYGCENCIKICPVNIPCGTYPQCSVKYEYYRDHDMDNYGTSNVKILSCTPVSGYAALPSDCDDNDAATNPAAIEACDGYDNNCNNQNDETCSCTPVSSKRACGSDIGECRKGEQTCSGSSWSSCENEIPPTTEICDGKDNNCNGGVDEYLIYSCMNYETCTEEPSCDPCKDAPTETCDTKDNDCDGEKNEGLSNCCLILGEEDHGCNDDAICPGVIGKKTCQNFEWSACKAECPLEMNIEGIIGPDGENITIEEIESLTALPDIRKEEHICDSSVTKVLDFKKLMDFGCKYRTNDEKEYKAIEGEQKFTFFLGENNIYIKCTKVEQKIIYSLKKAEDCEIFSYLSDFKLIVTDFVNQGLITEEEKGFAEETAKKVTENTIYSKKEDSAVVTHTLETKENISDMEFRLQIPKDCANDTKSIEFLTGNYTIIDDDPVIAWRFSKFDEKIDVSYRLKDVVNDRCLEQIKGLPIARVIADKNRFKFNTASLLLPAVLLAIGISIPFILNRKGAQAKDISQNELISKIRANYLEQAKKIGFKTKGEAEGYLSRYGLGDEDNKWILERLFK
ncbi:MAG: DUF4215 domain-containing protein [Nanoarchaeota archaeon]|nr:DUF4215 domain-containing protein [Nanoarchaeota archaeon]